MMTTIRNSKGAAATVLALAMLAAAIAAPSAFARTDPPSALPTHASGATQSGPVAKAPAPRGPAEVRVVRVTSDPGFDWGDAALGAGTTVALVAIGLGGAIAVLSYRRQRAVATS